MPQDVMAAGDMVYYKAQSAERTKHTSAGKSSSAPSLSQC